MCRVAVIGLGKPVRRYRKRSRLRPVLRSHERSRSAPTTRPKWVIHPKSWQTHCGRLPIRPLDGMSVLGPPIRFCIITTCYHLGYDYPLRFRLGAISCGTRGATHMASLRRDMRGGNYLRLHPVRAFPRDRGAGRRFWGRLASILTLDPLERLFFARPPPANHSEVWLPSAAPSQKLAGLWSFFAGIRSSSALLSWGLADQLFRRCSARCRVGHRVGCPDAIAGIIGAGSRWCVTDVLRCILNAERATSAQGRRVYAHVPRGPC